MFKSDSRAAACCGLYWDAQSRHWTSAHIGANNLYELLAATAELVGSVIQELDEVVIANVARALKAAGIAAPWKQIGLSARDLAEHLSAASDGVRHKVATLEEYRDRMHIAVKLICRQQRVDQCEGRIAASGPGDAISTKQTHRRIAPKLPRRA